MKKYSQVSSSPQLFMNQCALTPSLPVFQIQPAKVGFYDNYFLFNILTASNISPFYKTRQFVTFRTGSIQRSSVGFVLTLFLKIS